MNPKSNYFLNLFLAFLLLTFGCDNEPIGGAGQNNNDDTTDPVVTSITIAASSEEPSINDTIDFNVVANNGNNVTLSSDFYLNGTLLTSNSYLFLTEGDYLFTAIYDGLTSNELSFTITENNSNELISITLSSNLSSYYINEVATFTVVGNDGIDYTDQASITMGDGSVLTDNTYTTTTEGSFTFTANYDSFVSNQVQIDVLAPPASFQKNVLIEDYTGTWCGYCPRVSYGIELVKAETDKAVVVAIHRQDEYNFNAQALESLIGLTGYPTAMLNRTISWGYPEPNNIGQVINLTNGAADLGLSINPTTDGNTMDIAIEVKFGIDYSLAELALVVYVLEDDLFSNQENYTSYYGGAAVLTNFEHDHVLRASLTDLLGDPIPQSSTTADNIFTQTITTNVPSNVSNSDNLSVVAFVVNASGNGTPGSSSQAINVRSAHFGDTQTLQEL
ncbi:Omp28-related outer membrane protein [Flavobacteriaceae bacterium]|nr:Omp28-related outer membrane protein [Flavobacteriaceae bacterium]MDA9026061.1 Omp28-related outer membrane protein [Flavobacteriaceae bacterium]